MQRLAMELIRPEMISALDVVDAGGRILIRAGRPLQESHIQAMQTLGYGTAYVNLPSLSEKRIDDMLRPETRMEAVKLIRKVYDDFKTKGEVDGNPLRDLASKLLNEVIRNRGWLFQFVDLGFADAGNLSAGPCAEGGGFVIADRSKNGISTGKIA